MNETFGRIATICGILYMIIEFQWIATLQITELKVVNNKICIGKMSIQ